MWIQDYFFCQLLSLLLFKLSLVICSSLLLACGSSLFLTRYAAIERIDNRSWLFNSRFAYNQLNFMENQAKTQESAAIELVIKQVILSWTAQNKSVSDFFNTYEDTFYSNPVAPGRNRAIYLLGHLVAVNDGMLPIFGLGPKLFPELEAPFVSSPDQAEANYPSLAELKQHWEKLNETLSNHFNNMTWTDWLGKHSLVSAEDFAVNPVRNKLNVLLNRTNHQSYHLGQIKLLKA
jgi:hypothetical protein